MKLESPLVHDSEPNEQLSINNLKDTYNYYNQEISDPQIEGINKIKIRNTSGTVEVGVFYDSEGREGEQWFSLFQDGPNDFLLSGYFRPQIKNSLNLTNKNKELDLRDSIVNVVYDEVVKMLEYREEFAYEDIGEIFHPDRGKPRSQEVGGKKEKSPVDINRLIIMEEVMKEHNVLATFIGDDFEAYDINSIPESQRKSMSEDRLYNLGRTRMYTLSDRVIYGNAVVGNSIRMAPLSETFSSDDNIDKQYLIDSRYTDTTIETLKKDFGAKKENHPMREAGSYSLKNSGGRTEDWGEAFRDLIEGLIAVDISEEVEMILIRLQREFTEKDVS